MKLQKVRKHLRNRAGITLVEVLLVTSLAGFMYLAIGELMIFMKKNSERFNDNFASTAAEAVGAMATQRDFSAAGPSYNYLRMAGQVDFFEHHDAPCTVNCTRRIALTPGAGQLVMLTEARGMGPATPISPMSFFNVGRVPNVLDPESEGVATFDAARMVTQLANQNGLMMNAQNQFRLIQFFSPQPMRRVVPGQMPNLAVPPQFSSFIGFFDGGGVFQPVPASSGLTPQTHPGGGYEFTSLQMFFEGLPPDSGQQSFAMARGVELIRYSVQATQYEGYDTGEFVREVYDPALGAYGPPQQISVPVCGVEIIRGDVNMPATRSVVYTDKNTLNRRVVANSGGARQLGSSCAPNLPNSLNF